MDRERAQDGMNHNRHVLFERQHVSRFAVRLFGVSNILILT